MAEKHVAAFVDGVITGEPFAQVRVKPYLVAAGLLSTKADRVEDRRRALNHECEASAFPIVLHCCQR
jgi:hypothetical protein